MSPLITRRKGTSDIANSYLYFKTKHLQMQSCEEWSEYSLVKEDEVLALIIVFEEKSNAYSPYRGHFGGVQVLGEVSGDELRGFIQQTLNALKEKGITNLTLKQAAQCYPYGVSIHNALVYCGFKLDVIDRNFHLNLAMDFYGSLHDSEKRRLNKCRSAGFTFDIKKNGNIIEVHSLIRNSRKAKGYPLNMSLTEMNQLFEVFPDDHFAFEVRDDNRLIATLVAIKVSNDTLYAFCPAHDSEYNDYSPLVFLYDRVVEFCLKEGVKIIDLGIATDNGVNNDGLIRFKQRLGGIESPKTIYSYEIQKFDS